MIPIILFSCKSKEHTEYFFNKALSIKIPESLFRSPDTQPFKNELRGLTAFYNKDYVNGEYYLSSNNMYLSLMLIDTTCNAINVHNIITEFNSIFLAIYPVKKNISEDSVMLKSNSLYYQIFSLPFTNKQYYCSYALTCFKGQLLYMVYCEQNKDYNTFYDNCMKVYKSIKTLNK